jgi:hypothetical protein
MVVRCSLLVAAGVACSDPAMTPSFDAPPPAVDGAPDAAAPGPDAPPLAPRCGTTDLLRDDFESPDPGQVRWAPFALSGSPGRIQGGQAILPIEAAAPTRVAGLVSSRHYLFDESQLSVDAQGVADLAGVETDFNLTSAAGSVGIRVGGGAIEARRRVLADPPETVGSIPFAPASHRYWRLREDDDRIHWELSADGLTWTALAEAPSGLLDRPAKAELLIVESSTVAGEIRFDDVNGVGEPADTIWCPIADLRDDFDDPLVDEQWEVTSNGACLAEERDGVLQVTNPTVGERCGYRSALGYDLTDGQIAIDGAGASATGEPDMLFGVELGPGGDLILFQHLLLFGPFLVARRVPAGTAIADAMVIDYVVYSDPPLHRFWRFAHRSGNLALETSPDRGTWTLLAEVPDVSVGDVFVVLESTIAGPGPIAFDELF